MKTKYMFCDKSLYYITFNDNFKLDELDADLKEIKEKGFTSIIWKNVIDRDGSIQNNNIPVERIVEFCTIVRTHSLKLYLDISPYLPSIPLIKEESQQDQFTPSYFTADTILAQEYKTTIISILNQLATGQVSVHGFHISLSNFYHPPSRFFLTDDLSGNFFTKFKYHFKDRIISETGNSVDYSTLSHYQQLIAEKLSALLTEVKGTVKMLFGDQANLTIYPAEGNGFSYSHENFGTYNMQPTLEVLECGHGEEIVDRPARIITQFKIAQSRPNTHDIPYQKIQFWGDNYESNHSGYSPEIFDYWVDLACTFGVPIISSIYSKESITYREKIKKGIPHPLHPSWKIMPSLNQKITMMEEVTRFAPCKANIAVLYPADTFIRYQKAERTALQKSFYDFIFKLLRAGYSFEILHPTQFIAGKINQTSFSTMSNNFDSLIIPYPQYLSEPLWNKLKKIAQSSINTVIAGMPPLYTEKGERIIEEFGRLLGTTLPDDYKQGNSYSIKDLEGSLISTSTWGKAYWQVKGLEMLMRVNLLPAAVRHKTLNYWGILPSALPLNALDKLLNLSQVKKIASCPSSAFLNISQENEDIIFSLCPNEFNGVINGTVTYKNIVFEIDGCKNAMALRINMTNKEIVSHALFGAAVIRFEH